MACRAEVNDSEPLMSKSHKKLLVSPNTCVIGAAVFNSRRHANNLAMKITQ